MAEEFREGQLASLASQPSAQTEPHYNFFVCRLRTPQMVNIGEDIPNWPSMADEITPLDDSTWKLWLAVRFHQTDDTRRRVFSRNRSEDWQKVDEVGVTYPAYLRTQQGEAETTFTVVSENERAGSSVVSFLMNTYEAIQGLDLNTFLRQNDSLVVKSAQVVDEGEEEESFKQFLGHKPTLRELMNDGVNINLDLLHVALDIDIEQPPLTVWAFSVDLSQRRLWLATRSEMDLSKGAEKSVMDSVFTLADRFYVGERLQES